MKCPKCNYTSFDHYLTCTKCKKDMTLAREKMNFFSYADCDPLFPWVLGASVGAMKGPGSQKISSMEEPSTLDFPETEGIELKTRAGDETVSDDGDLSFDFEDDFAFGDDETAAVEPKHAPPGDENTDGDMNFTFGEVRDELTVGMKPPAEQKKAHQRMEEDDTPDGDIDFDFNLDLDENEPDTLSGSGDAADTRMVEKEKATVTAELERSVSALVDDMEESSPGKSIEIGIDDMGRQTAELEVLDLDLDLDKMDDK